VLMIVVADDAQWGRASKGMMCIHTARAVISHRRLLLVH
jgi:hypothetical protein